MRADEPEYVRSERNRQGTVSSAVVYERRVFASRVVLALSLWGCTLAAADAAPPFDAQQGLRTTFTPSYPQEKFAPAVEAVVPANGYIYLTAQTFTDVWIEEGPRFRRPVTPTRVREGLYRIRLDRLTDADRLRVGGTIGTASYLASPWYRISDVRDVTPPIIDAVDVDVMYDSHLRPGAGWVAHVRVRASDDHGPLYHFIRDAETRTPAWSPTLGGLIVLRIDHRRCFRVVLSDAAGNITEGQRRCAEPPAEAVGCRALGATVDAAAPGHGADSRSNLLFALSVALLGGLRPRRPERGSPSTDAPA